MNGKSESLKETSLNYPNLKESITDRKSSFVIEAMRYLQEEGGSGSVRPSDIQKIIKVRFKKTYSTRHIHNILRELANNNVVEKDEEKKGRYLLADNMLDILSDLEKSFEKVKCLEGDLIPPHYIRTVLFNIDPEYFFNERIYIQLNDAMKEIGFKSYGYPWKEKKDSSWQWTFRNLNYKLIDILISFEEIKKDKLKKLGRKENIAILMELHIHVRETHGLYKYENLRFIDLRGKRISYIKSFLDYEKTKSKLTKTGILKKFCNYISWTIVFQITNILIELCSDKVNILTQKTTRDEEIFPEKSEIWIK